MSDPNYLAHLEEKIAEIDARITAAQAKLDSGDLTEKTRALAELVRLRDRHDALVSRVAAAKAKGADHWRALHMSFKEEADALADTLEDWLTRI